MSETQTLAEPPRYTLLDWAIAGAIAFVAALIVVLWVNVDALYGEVDTQRAAAEQARNDERTTLERVGAARAELNQLQQQILDLRNRPAPPIDRATPTDGTAPAPAPATCPAQEACPACAAPTACPACPAQSCPAPDRRAIVCEEVKPRLASIRDGHLKAAVANLFRDCGF